MRKEEQEFTTIILQLFKRVHSLEMQIDDITMKLAAERHFVSDDQLNEITNIVDQNLTRKLREASERAEKSF